MTVASPPVIALVSDPSESLVLLVPSAPAAPGAVCASIARWLRGHADAEVLGDVQLVASEMVANSVRHAGGSQDDLISVSAQLTDEGVRLEVEDSGLHGTGGVARCPASFEPAGGLGLTWSIGCRRAGA